MMVINCPFCGPRNEPEYTYGGQAHVAYPESPDQLTDDEWGQYLFYRDNPRGTHAERWRHSAGCRKWFNVIRTTHTYVISAVYPISEMRPDGSATGFATQEAGS